MPNAQLINRSDLPKEPDYNCTEEAVSPVQACALNDEEKEPKQKIVKAYFTNLEGELLEKITKEKEIYLVIETENMGGEKVIINLPEHYGDFKYEGQLITEDKVLKLSVGGNTEKIKLEVVPKKRKVTPRTVSTDNDTTTTPPPTEEPKQEPEEEKKDRELKRIVFKRKDVLWGKIIGSKLKIIDPGDADLYGHWWVEIDNNEAYGWWPDGQVSFTETIQGVDGILNWGDDQDPHLGDDGNEEFSPVIDADDPRTTDDIIACIRDFAENYGTKHPKWSYPARGNMGNCHTFQEDMMKHCNINRKGTVTHKDTKGKVTSTDTAKNVIEVNE